MSIPAAGDGPVRAGTDTGWEAPDSIAYHAVVQPDRLACVELSTGVRADYRDLHQRVGRCAAWLLDRLGGRAGQGGAGQRVGWLGRNSLAELVTSLACARAGAVFLPMNWRLTVPELTWLASDATPALLIHDAEFAAAAAALADAVPGLSIIEASAAALEQPSFSPLPTAVPRDAHDPATIIYTSGTSGRPKGAIITEQNIFFTAFNFALLNHVDRNSVFLCDMPLFHIIGIVTIARSTLLQGGTLLISPGFDPALTLERMADPALGVTHYMCVPQMAQTLRLQSGYDPAKLSRLVFFGTGGAPNPPALVRRFIAEGIPMADGYGSSEGGTILGMPLGDPLRTIAKAGSAGIPPASVQVRLVDEDGKDVVGDAVGELLVRGPNVSPGYWNRAAGTGDGATGWFHTGDTARRDRDGFYYIVDRKKDMYISGGENVYPAEVEAALLELDAVAEACVIGIPDAQWGEVGCAHIVLRPGSTLAEETVLAHCRGCLARYKVPKRIEFVESLPRTASGKLLKGVLRDRYRAGG